jgi:RNA polymerase sigma-70 factor, ECF subfamily
MCRGANGDLAWPSKMLFIDARQRSVADLSRLTAVLTSRRAALLRAAMRHVHNRALAEEVLQETSLAAMKGLHHFQARSSLETWLFRILINQARKKRAREGRTIPCDCVEGANAAQCCLGASREGDPDRALLAQELRTEILAALACLPGNQRAVVYLHDVEGLSPPEICERLAISEANRRVLLHRARSTLRIVLARYLFSGDASNG